MHRVLYHYPNGHFYRSWAESRDEAKEEAITHPNPPVGLAVTFHPNSLDNKHGNGYAYYLVEGFSVRGVSKGEFAKAVS